MGFLRVNAHHTMDAACGRNRAGGSGKFGWSVIGFAVIVINARTFGQGGAIR
jgi:hypothetical protein